MSKFNGEVISRSKREVHAKFTRAKTGELFGELFCSPKDFQQFYEKSKDSLISWKVNKK